MEREKISQERILHGMPGFIALVASILLILLSVPAGLAGFRTLTTPGIIGGILLATLMFILGILILCGLKVIHPNEALVLTLFGKYHGTLYHAGFHWVNPFCTAINPSAGAAAAAASAAQTPGKSGAKVNIVSKKVSLKAMTLDNKHQKVNDKDGNPVEIGTIVIWKVRNATKAVLNVENYSEYLSIQCDAITRNAVRNYPYDVSEEADEKTLRGSSQEIADIMQQELQEKVEDAGIEVLDVRITHLAYAQEIASAMLQRQQAAAIIDARQKIVEGAVGMVEMALKQLSENHIVELDEERKAAMVSNLLVVLCGNKDAQPIVNSGSIY